MLSSWDKIKRKEKIVVILFLMAYFIYNALTLSYSPLPWYDEVWYAGITKSWLENGTFHGTVCPYFYQYKEVLTYGPLYFITTGLSIKLLGWGIFQFRVVNLFFGIGVLFMSYIITRKYVKKQAIIYFLLILTATDPLFMQNIHSGRMDSCALFFALVTYVFLLKDDKKLIHFFLAGITTAITILFTPRSSILFVSLLIFLIYHLFRNFRFYFKGLIIWGITILTLYIGWIFWGFGGFDYFLDFYLKNNSTFVGGFIGFAPNIRTYQLPLIIFAGLFLISTLLIKKAKEIPAILYLIIFNILLFYAIVTDTGMYSIYVIPFFYIGIALSIELITKIPAKIKLIVPVILLIINFSIAATKLIIVVYDYSLRDYKYVDEIVAKTIPPDSKVIASDRYFYSVTKNKCHFETIDYDLYRYKIINYHITKKEAEYLIFKKNYSPFVKKTVIKATNAVKIADINPPKKESLGQKIALKILGHPISSSYQGEIYKVDFIQKDN